MRLQILRSFLLPVLFAIALALPPAFAQSPSDAELKAMNGRVAELFRAGKFGEAIPLAERYAAAAKARYGENAPEYTAALNNLATLLQDFEPSFRGRAGVSPRARHRRKNVTPRSSRSSHPPV